MGKIYQNLVFIFFAAVILTGCGSGLCPMRNATGICITSSGGSSGGLHAAIGTLDTSFGGTGIITTPIGAAFDSANAAIIQPDGKIILAGSSSAINFAAVRYHSDGSLDTTFNTTGKVTTVIGPGTASANAIALQPDGKIILAGNASNGANDDFVVVRYHSNGSLDTTFNTTGIVVTVIGVNQDVANEVALQPDGKIILAGYAHNGANYDFAAARYHSDGSLDTTFNTTGKVTTTIGAGLDSAYGVTLQPDGKIILAGLSNNGVDDDFAVVRYHSDGSLDTTFNTTGKVTTTIGAGNDSSSFVTLQPDGKIISVGSSSNGANNDFAVVRYNSDGSLDTTFNTTGKVMTPIGAGADQASTATLQSDGKIILAGSSNNGANNDFAVVRYNSDGSLDTTFNTTGKVTTPIGAGADAATSVTLQSDGKIIVAGSSNNGVDNDFAVVRYR